MLCYIGLYKRKHRRLYQKKVVDKMGVDEMGVDEMGVDKMGVDEWEDTMNRTSHTG